MKRIILLLLCASLCHAASVTIAESAYTDASGRLATGTITISWPSFSNGVSNIAAGSTTVTVTSGVMSVSLTANDTADPPFNYTASFRLQASNYSQQWKVPTVAGPLTIQAVTWSSNSPVTVGLDQLRRPGYFAGDISYFDGTLWKRLPRGTNGQSLTIDTSLSGYLKWATISGGGGGAWGSITGTLTDQTDLASALATKMASSNNLSDLASASTARTNLGLGTAATSASSAFAAVSHAHAAADVTSGVFNIARLATGTPNGSKFVRDDGVLATPSGSGNVSGPISATDNCFSRFDGTTGTTIQDSAVCADDSGNVTAPSFASTGAYSGSIRLQNVTGNMPALPANSAGWGAPASGGTSYLLRPPPTITAGILFAATPATVDNVLQSAVTSGNLSGDVATSGSGAATIQANVVTSSKLAVVNTRRTSCIPFGSKNASVVLADTDLADSALYMINAASTLVEITVRANGGTPNIILGRDRAGSVVNLTSSALATGSSGAIACSKASAVAGLDGATTCSATLQNTSLNAGDWIVPVSGTAGGTAKEMTACFTTTVN